MLMLSSRINQGIILGGITVKHCKTMGKNTIHPYSSETISDSYFVRTFTSSGFFSGVIVNTWSIEGNCNAFIDCPRT